MFLLLHRHPYPSGRNTDSGDSDFQSYITEMTDICREAALLSLYSRFNPLVKSGVT